MTDDATLDQFASGGSDGDEEADAETPSGDDADEPTAEPAVEPAVSTYRSAPDGRACADCDSSVTELWRDGDSLVCPDCKQWEQ